MSGRPDAGSPAGSPAKPEPTLAEPAAPPAERPPAAAPSSPEAAPAAAGGSASPAKPDAAATAGDAAAPAGAGSLTKAASPAAAEAPDAVQIIGRAQDELYQCEQKGEGAVWDRLLFRELLSICRPTLPKHLLVRVCGLVAKYAVHFGAEARDRSAAAVLRICLGGANGDQQLRQVGLRCVHDLCRRSDTCPRNQHVVSRVVVSLLQEKLQLSRGEDPDPTPAVAALDRVMQVDPHGALVAVFTLLNTEAPHEQDEQVHEELRDVALAHLASHLVPKHLELIQQAAGLELQIKEEALKFLQAATKGEFQLMLGIISSLHLTQSSDAGPQGIVDMLVGLLDEGDDDPEEVARTLGVAECAGTYLARGADGGPLFHYLLERWVTPAEALDMDLAADGLIKVYRRISEIAPFCSHQAAAGALRAFWPFAERHLPLPDEGGEPNFSVAESVVRTVIQLGRQAPGTLAELSGLRLSSAGADAAAPQGDFRERIQLAVEQAGAMVADLGKVKAELLQEHQGPKRYAKLNKIEAALDNLKSFVSLCAPLQQEAPVLRQDPGMSWGKSKIYGKPASALKRKLDAAAAPPSKEARAEQGGRAQFAVPQYNVS
eukprot:TRINITY_DN33593_c0_g1_i1.p2 TRINITY_DN33593_c0_g1~~TRINITY_DN33593_c0_g1_i1.p2  ORF type:complete len:603 (+),score=202.71 TRINITY_DN33593_c0_g1_i1:72-1880(+)